MKVGLVLLLSVMLAACGGEKFSEQAQVNAPPQEVSKAKQKTFRRQVFLYIDDFNRRMRNADIDAHP